MIDVFALPFPSTDFVLTGIDVVVFAHGPSGAIPNKSAANILQGTDHEPRTSDSYNRDSIAWISSAI
jgi:hypothetical protein